MNKQEFIQDMNDLTFAAAVICPDGHASVDMNLARQLWMNKLRQLRIEKMKKLDVQMIIAFEKDDEVLKADISAQKEQLRNMPVNYSLANVTDWKVLLTMIPDYLMDIL